jgi:hypothetical protein
MKLLTINQYGKMVMAWAGTMLILLHLSSAVVVQARKDHYAFAGRIPAVETEIAIGELVGAEYDFQQNDFKLYATEAPAGQATAISVDDIVKMAQAGWTVSNFGFSLEHDRLAARFGAQDIFDLASLASKLRRAEEPVSEYLNRRLSAEARQFLKRESFPPDSLNQLRQVLAHALNQSLEDKSLYDPQRFARVELTMETQQLANRSGADSDLIRRNRYLLEDAYPEILKRQGPYMQIRYLPLETEHLLKPIFHGSSAEATFGYTDRTLKDLAHCEKVADDLRLGPCELFLLTEDVARKYATGSSPTLSHGGSHVLYFDLQTKFKFDYPAVVWYESPRILVKAAARQAGASPPKPAQTFAENLTRNMDQLLTHKKLGAEFRRLKAFFLLHQTFGWARLIFVPINQSLLMSYRPARLKQVEPIRSKTYPVFVFPDPLDPRRLQISQLSGGVHFSINPQGLFAGWQGSRLREAHGASVPADIPSYQPNPSPQAGSQEATIRRPPGLKVEPVVKEGRKLLKVNISDLLGL